MSFSYLISVARSSNIMLNRNGKGGILVLFLILKERLLAFHHRVWCELWVCQNGLLCWNMFPINQLWWIFIMNGCLNLCQMLFLHLFRWSYDFYSFINVVYHIYLFANDKTYLHPWNKSHWSCYMILLCIFRFGLLYLVKNFFTCIHQSFYFLTFFLYSVCLLLVSGGTCRMNLEVFYLLQFFEIV